MTRFGHAGGIFRSIHDALVEVRIDWAPLERDRARLPPSLVERARQVWAFRAQTEFRSVQAMTRFLSEVLAAGDPLEVYAGVADAITDEIRHTALCVGVVEALGGAPALPEPLVDEENAEFLAMPMPQRALATAVSLLAVSETISVALIADLRSRCHHPTLRAVLDATLADEDTHRDFGWEYVRASLTRFDEPGREFARLVVETTLAPHRAATRRAFATLPAERRRKDAHPEPELAALGLLSDEREALIIDEAITTVLAPRLAAVGLGQDVSSPDVP